MGKSYGFIEITGVVAAINAHGHHVQNGRR